ncbi:MAG: hypothetical protein ABIS38_01785 [Sphingomicrobium sp.]
MDRRPYAAPPARGQVLRFVYQVAGIIAPMVGIAIVMFVTLFGWGASYFGWSDPDGKVQLALATSFVLGIIGGYRAKG